MTYEAIGLLALCLLAGLSFGIGLTTFYYRFKLGRLRSVSETIISDAKKESADLTKETEIHLEELKLNNHREIEKLWQSERKKMQKEEERIEKKEDKIESRMNLVERKLSDIEKREAVLKGRKEQVDEQKKVLNHQILDVQHKLESVSQLTLEEAKTEILKQAEEELRSDTAKLTKRCLDDIKDNCDKEAQRIISTAINRLATPCVSEATTTTIQLPNDEMKGRIIGREGRNIRTFERSTGINLIMDDTPGAVVLSGFDPVRKQVAKTALQDLILDGRIHPSRIEEAVVKAEECVEKQIKQFGEDAAQRAGAVDIHPEIISLLGKLKFRYSYGQNVLDHSLEVSNIMGIIADELHLNGLLARKIGLLHDIGKALSHEVEGPHAVIGHDIALKYGESDEVANGIGCHHNEMSPITIEGSLCGAADAISAARPGARSEAVEEYIKRIKKLEAVAYEFPGVEKAYALQAGKEIRVVVLPEMIDDEGTLFLAKDISKKVEKTFNYPGRIKVTIIREKRAVEYAV